MAWLNSRFVSSAVGRRDAARSGPGICVMTQPQESKALYKPFGPVVLTFRKSGASWLSRLPSTKVGGGDRMETPDAEIACRSWKGDSPGG